MVAEVRITGAEQLRALGRDLKAAGEEGKGLRRKMLAGMRAAGRPLAEKVKESARDNLPKRGGLNEWAAASRVTVRNSLTGKSVGTRIVVGKRKHDISDMDAGSLRHPVYGNRKKWVGQSIAEGAFSKPLEHSAPEIQAALLAVMEMTARQIERGI